MPSIELDEAIVWHGPECGDNGLIQGLQGALLDGTADDESRALS